MKDLFVIVVAMWAIIGSLMCLWFIGEKLGQSFDNENCILPRNDAQMLNGYNQ